jgi:WD40 repeat protein
MSDGEPRPGARLSAQSPWPGLRAFREEDSEFFFGRERETAALLDLVKRSPVFVFHGQSGLGKTSLVQAGLFPALRKLDFLCLRLRLDFDKAEPLADQIGAALALELDREGVAGPRPASGESLWHFFHRRDVDFWGPRNRLLTPVIVLDQFEEVFTLGQRNEASAARVAALAAELEALIEHRAPPSVIAELEADPDKALRYDLSRESVRMIFSLREDFLPHLRTWRERIPSLLEQEFRLERMSGAQAMYVVQRSGGDLLEPGVDRLIVDFVSTSQRLRSSARRLEDREVEPALLCVVCEELNIRRAGNPRITAGLLTGQQHDIIGGFYERAFVGVDQPVRDWLEERLLTATGYRQRAALEDALQIGLPLAAFDLLVDRRVLHREERDGVVWLELTHDLLSDPALRSRLVREQRRQAQLARAKLRRFRFAASGLGLLVVAAVLATFFAVKETVRARAQEKAALAAEAEAAVQRKDALNEAENARTQEKVALDAEEESARQKRNALAEAKRAQAQELIAVGAEADTAKAKQRVVEQLVASYAESGRAYLEADQPENAAVELNAGIQLGGNGDAIRYEMGRALGELDCGALILRGHSRGPVNSAEFSPDGQKVATAGADGTAKIWSSASGKLLASLTHGESLRFARFSPDGKFLATAGVDSFVRLWDLKSLGSAALKVGAGDIRSLQFSSGGDPKLLVLSGGGEALLWNLKDGATPVAVPEQMRGNVTAVAFDSTGQLVAAVRKSDGVWIWECELPSASVRQLAQPKTGVEATAVNFLEGSQGLAVGESSGRVQLYSKDGENLGEVGGGDDEAPVIACEMNPAMDRGLSFSERRVSVWDPKAGKTLFSISSNKGDFAGARFDPTGAYVVTAGSDGWIRFHDAANGLLLRKMRAADKGRLTSVNLLAESFSADGAFLVTAGDDSLARIWRVSDCRLPVTLVGHGEAITMATFSLDGGKILTASRDQTARLWDAASGRPIGQPMRDAKGWVLQAVFSPPGLFGDEGEYILTAGYESSLWNAKDGSFVRTLGNPGDLADPFRAALCGTFSPDGRFAVVGSRDGHWTKYEVSTGNTVLRSPDSAGRIVTLAYNPQTDSLMATGAGNASLWRAAFGTVQSWYQRGDCQVAIFDPSGSHVAVGLKDGNIDVHELITLAVRTFRGHSARVVSLAFSQDGKFLVSGSADGTARIWDFNSGKLLSTLPGEKGSVGCVAFSPQGDLVATGGASGSALIWDRASGRLLDEMPGHAGAVTGISFSPDGRRLLTAGMDGRARIWDLSPDGRSAGQIAALVNSRIPFHLDGSQPVDGSLQEASMAYDLEGNPQSGSVAAEPLQQAGDWVEQARLAYLEGDGPEALELLRKAVEARADWPAVGALASELELDTQGLQETIRLGSSRIDAVVYNPSGDRVLVAPLGRSGWIVDPASGKRISLTGHLDWLLDGAFSPDGKWVATASKDLSLRIWDAASGEAKRVIPQDSQPANVSFSPDGRYLASDAMDGSLGVWDPLSGRRVQKIASGGAFIFHFYPDSTHIAVVSGDGAVAIRQIEGLAAAMVINASGDGKPINDMAVSPDGTLLATAGRDNLLKVWDSQSGKLKFERNLNAPVNQVMFEEGQRLVTLSESYTLTVWDTATGALLKQARHTGSQVDLAFPNPSGDSVLAVARSNAVVWNEKTGLFAGSIGSIGDRNVRGAFSPDGRHLALGSGPLLTFWSTDNLRTRGRRLDIDGRTLWAGLSAGRTLMMLTLEERLLRLIEPLNPGAGATRIALPKGTDDVDSAVLSANGDRVLMVDHKGVASVGDFASGRWRSLEGTAGSVLGLSSAGDVALTLAAGSGSEGAAVIVWDVSSGRPLHRIDAAQGGAIRSLLFAPDGRRILTTGGDGTARLWDLATGEQISIMAGQGPGIEDARFSSDGRELATSGGEGGTRLWSTGNGRLIATLDENHEAVNSSDFSADGRFVLTGDETGTLRLWDRATGKLLSRFHLHSASCQTCGFLGRGDRIFSQSIEGRLWTWEIAGQTTGIPDLAATARRAAPWTLENAGDANEAR